MLFVLGVAHFIWAGQDLSALHEPVSEMLWDSALALMYGTQDLCSWVPPSKFGFQAGQFGNIMLYGHA